MVVLHEGRRKYTEVGRDIVGVLAAHLHDLAVGLGELTHELGSKPAGKSGSWRRQVCGSQQGGCRAFRSSRMEQQRCRHISSAVECARCCTASGGRWARWSYLGTTRMLVWAVKHLAWAYNRLARRRLSDTFARAAWSESCFADGRIRRKCALQGAGLGDAAEDSPEVGSCYVWVGRSEGSSDRMMLTVHGAISARAIKRLPEEGQRTSEDLQRVRGLLWAVQGGAEWQDQGERPSMSQSQ